MKLRSILLSALVAVSVSVFLFMMITGSESIPASATAQPNVPIPKVLVDAGHGGEDGGAIGVDGVIEKDINLNIALSVADMLRLCGVEVSMTRSDDSDLSEEGATVKERKYSDMSNRLSLYNAKGTAVLSIHQNRFTDKSARGAQVFYSTNNEHGSLLASSIRNSVRQLLQPDNEREIKPAGSNIFLLKNTENPAVIVECGFISNPEECAMLCDGSYRREMSFAVTTGFMDYIHSDK